MSKAGRRAKSKMVDSDDDVTDLDFRVAAAKPRKAPAKAKKAPPKVKKPRKPRQTKKKGPEPADVESARVDEVNALELTEEYSTALILQSLSQRSHASYYQKVQLATPTSLPNMNDQRGG